MDKDRIRDRSSVRYRDRSYLCNSVLYKESNIFIKAAFGSTCLRVLELRADPEANIDLMGLFAE
jgi:hypothetical protein